MDFFTVYVGRDSNSVILRQKKTRIAGVQNQMWRSVNDNTFILVAPPPKKNTKLRQSAHRVAAAEFNHHLQGGRTFWITR